MNYHILTDIRNREVFMKDLLVMALHKKATHFELLFLSEDWISV